jgi:2-oxoglutarate ferredoxin oxidoreductase subunit delta
MKAKVGSILLHQQRCKRCGVCVELCPREVFISDKEGYPKPVNMDKCTYCQLCELWCPDYAIEVRGVEDDG